MTEATIQKELTVSFRKNKETGEQRPSVELVLSIPTQEGVANLLMSEDPKVSGFIVDLVEGSLSDYARRLVGEDLEFSQEKLQALIAEGKFNIETLANLPRSERNSIGKEDLEAFAKDYVLIMPEVTGKSIESVQTAAGLFMERFKRCAGQNDVLTVLKNRLGQFVEAADAEVLGKHERVLTYLTGKVDELLSLEVSADAL